ncbi:STAS domain-containing protein [Acidocella sp.]|jgi:chemotaxis protein CheX|uniref:STAS domain-containing protein n=1 Tax=Acidocella sp. TaxID=50710 RepID=UPI002634E54C|nr:STAS domain-containing protein [Acidocella sp.]
MTEGLELPAILDLVAAPGLLEAFTGRRGQALVVNGASVQRLGGQCLQVLLAASRAWAADDVPFAVAAPSEEFAANLELMGVCAADLAHRAPLAGKEFGE